MKIAELLKTRKTFSFEFFPPRTPETTRHLFDALELLRELRPDFVSVTHSPSGFGTLKTAALAKLIRDRFDLNPMAHLACITHTRAEIEGIVRELDRIGIDNILALRGDYPPGYAGSSADPRGYKHAHELVAQLRQISSACIGVAGYPQKHPQAATLEQDIKHLGRKVACGADFIITQLFFINADYFSFVEQCRSAGITVPIIPGIMPVTGYSQLEKFSEMCGAAIPAVLRTRLEPVKNDDAAVAARGVDFASEQCRQLLENGAPGIHFYTLNKSRAALAILKKLKDTGLISN
ncbi:MAG: methylenetetrahydrofolate reductase [NAD(P)H] [Elusimicrobiaceae bacterium]|nr:methylenetetrahydrofolate reductase [NAD(P)H] [Elusimicrobiaceae bacterium]